MSKLPVVLFALIAGSAINAIAVAQDPAPATPTQTGQPGQKAAKVAPKPGDRHCLRHTGSHISVGKDGCLPVSGRSYSGDELRNTGETDAARALQRLDPSVTAGH